MAARGREPSEGPPMIPGPQLWFWGMELHIRDIIGRPWYGGGIG
ncbi:unnamed protein product, partial [marine sediment metagenome]